eukprot:TRINITY_DN2386_c0_g1_i2.p1 TRINITY_DN2386_c0_g1~~TRINITY_DN2386_c0_g1_i2.p1  ORF type:complete len:332 (+),score=108.63 TRINITY_DN2386_c0_g1_i2:86-1081(+)
MKGSATTVAVLYCSAHLAQAFVPASLPVRPQSLSARSRRSCGGVLRMQAEHIEAAVNFGSQLLAYSDEFTIGGAKPTVQLSTAAIGITSALTLGLFGALGLLLTKPGTGKIALSEEEASALEAVSSLYDVTDADKALTERGTAGEVKRKQAAEKFKLDYQRGKDVREVRDKTLAYAEVEGALLAALLRAAAPQEGEVFFDLGSGMGRALLSAAALHPELGECVGVEFLAGLHKQAQGYASKLSRAVPRAAPVRLLNADFCDPSVDISNAGIVFAYSTRYATASDGITLTELGEKLKELPKSMTPTAICSSRRASFGAKRHRLSGVGTPHSI